MFIHGCLNIFSSELCPTQYYRNVFCCFTVWREGGGIKHENAKQLCASIGGELPLLSSKDEADELLTDLGKFYSFEGLITGLDGKITLVSLVENKSKKKYAKLQMICTSTALVFIRVLYYHHPTFYNE